ncbi:MAG: type II toxin-antitoxin system HicA family toxin [Gallionella sp.]
MSKKEKQEDRLFASPKPKDFRWEDLVSVLKRYGFSESCQGGSHYTFQHISGHTFKMSKSHPGGILKGYQIDNAKEAIASVKNN